MSSDSLNVRLFFISYNWLLLIKYLPRCGINKYVKKAEKKLKKITKYWKFIVVRRMLLKPTKKAAKKLKVIVIRKHS